MVADRRMPAQERGERTQREVIEGAARAFLARGYDATSLAIITAESGVSAGSLYFHFKTKEQIGLAVIDQGRRKRALLRETVARHRSEDPVEALIDEAFALGEQLRGDAVVRAGLMIAFTAAPFRARGERAADDGVAELATSIDEIRARRALRTGLPSSGVARALLAGLLGGALVLEPIRNGSRPLDDLRDQITSAIEWLLPDEDRAPYLRLVGRDRRRTPEWMHDAVRSASELALERRR